MDFEHIAVQAVARQLVEKHAHLIHDLTETELEQPLNIDIIHGELDLMLAESVYDSDWWCVWGGSYKHILWELKTFYRPISNDEGVLVAWSKFHRLTAACLKGDHMRV